MKKTLKLMGLCALAVLALAGCKKEQPNNGKTSVKAAINQPTGNAKTGVAGLNLVWNSGDRIKVYSDDRSEVAEFTTTDNNVTEATFTTQAEMEVTDGFYAFYPSDDVTYAGGNFVLTLSDQQTGARNTFGADTYPMYATYASDKFTFHSPCALLAVAMNGTATIGSIVLTGGPDEKLNGTYTFNPSDMANSTLSDTGSNTITLSFGQSGLQLTNVNDTAYFALPAGKLANGFTVVFKGLDGGNLLTKTASANPNNTTAAETILRMPALTVNGTTVSHLIDLSTLTGDYEAQDGDTLTNTLSEHYNITVAEGATVTLWNASINPGNSYKTPHGACIRCDNDATIVIEGDNIMYVWTERMPCIWIAPEKTLTITGNGSLNASSTGKITSAIGAGYDSNNTSNCGNIVIESGNITANGGSCAAIGAGFSSSCGNITINGGNITATSTGASGIGCGNQMCKTCGNITINGGTITASGSRAGIGGGYQSNCGDITITGGTINATGTSGSGIGAGTDKSGTWGYCGNITISGGTVTASSTYAVGIGGGNQAVCGDILISGGTITATGGTNQVAIGSSKVYGICGTVTITNDVTSLTAIKKSGTPRCIGSSDNTSTIGTITIGGTEYPTGANPNVDDVTFVYPFQDPELTTGNVTDYQTAGTGHVTLTNAGTGPVTELGLCWGTSSTPTVSNSHAAAAGQTVGTVYDVNINGLTSGTLYYIRGYAKVGSNYYYASNTRTLMLVSSLSDWNSLASVVNNGTAATVQVFQTANISGVTTVVGTESHPFNGTYNGQGYAISNVSIHGSTHVGLFGYVNDASAVIENVVVASGSVSGTSQNVGAIVGTVYKGTVRYCANYAQVSSSLNTSANTRVGGIVGWMRSNGGTDNHVEYCINYGAVHAKYYVGGVVGSHGTGYLTYCQNYGTITGNFNTSAGIAGWSTDYEYVTNNHNGGNIIAGSTSNKVERFVIGNKNGNEGFPSNNTYLSSLTVTSAGTVYTGSSLSSFTWATALTSNPAGITIGGTTYGPTTPAP
jgi:hypothetical protein